MSSAAAIRAMPALNRGVTSAAIVGVLLCTYAHHVELSARAEPAHRALCDLGPAASCSRVLTSKFSKGLGLAAEGSALDLPNSVYGTLFYCLMIFLATFNRPVVVKLHLLLAFSSVCSSAYFAYILAFVLQDFCLVCVSTYIVNAIIIYLVFRKYNSYTNNKNVKLN